MKTQRAEAAKKPKTVTVVRWLFARRGLIGLNHYLLSRKPHPLDRNPKDFWQQDINAAFQVGAWLRQACGLPELEPGQYIRIELTYPEPQKSKP